MTGMDNNIRIQWLQIICLSLTTVGFFMLVNYYMEKPKIVLPLVVAMVFASGIFPTYLFFVMLNMENLNKEELTELRSLYVRLSAYGVMAVIFIFLLTIVIDMGHIGQRM